MNRCTSFTSLSVIRTLLLTLCVIHDMYDNISHDTSIPNYATNTRLFSLSCFLLYVHQDSLYRHEVMSSHIRNTLHIRML